MAMSSSSSAAAAEDPSTSDIVLKIPEECIQDGRRLAIEKHFQLFVDGYHLSCPEHFIEENRGLCLIDCQDREKQSNTVAHLLSSASDHQQLFRLIIHLPTRTFDDGKSIRFARASTSAETGCIEKRWATTMLDLERTSREPRLVLFSLPPEWLQRGRTILMAKDKISVVSNDDYDQNHCVHDNEFKQHDQLVSQNRMQLTIEVPVETFDGRQTISVKKEDRQSVRENFAYHRPAKKDIAATDDQTNNSMANFLCNSLWNPLLLNHGHLLYLTLDLSSHPNILHLNQLKITTDGQQLTVESVEPHGQDLLSRQVTLPPSVRLDQLKSQLHPQQHSLHITVPLSSSPSLLDQ